MPLSSGHLVIRSSGHRNHQPPATSIYHSPNKRRRLISKAVDDPLKVVFHEIERLKLRTVDIAIVGGLIAELKRAAEGTNKEVCRHNLPAIAVGILNQPVRATVDSDQAGNLNNKASLLKDL